jgi:uncharacterized protein YjbI with pentapeptide repeats
VALERLLGEPVARDLEPADRALDSELTPMSEERFRYLVSRGTAISSVMVEGGKFPFLRFRNNLINCRLTRCELQGAHFNPGVVLTRTAFFECDMSHVNAREVTAADCLFDDRTMLLSANFTEANLVNAVFQNKVQLGSIDGGPETIFQDAALVRARFRSIEGRASFLRANLDLAKLEGVTFVDSGFDDGTLARSELQNVHFPECTLSNVSFQKSTLISANFRKARTLDGASFAGATGLDLRKLADGSSTSRIFPPGVRLNKDFVAQRVPSPPRPPRPGATSAAKAASPLRALAGGKQ